MTQVGVVIPTVSSRFLYSALAVARSTVDTQIVVVDNAHSDVTRQLCAFRGWTHITKGTNLSYSESCNFGVAHTDTETVLLLNDDAVIGAGQLERWLGCGEHGARNAPLFYENSIRGALIVDAQGKVNCAGTAFHGAVPVHAGRGDEPADYRHRRCVLWPATTFAAVLIGRPAWDELGGLDEDYWYGYEDSDFCMRGWEAGLATSVCYRATVRHSEFGTRTREHDAANAARFFATWVMTGRARTALKKAGFTDGDDRRRTGQVAQAGSGAGEAGVAGQPQADGVTD